MFCIKITVGVLAAIPAEAEATGSERFITPIFVDSTTSCDVSASQKGVYSIKFSRGEFEDTESGLSSSGDELPAGIAAYFPLL